jgi:hypothetical protein
LSTKSLRTLVSLIVILLSAACSPRPASPTPAVTVEATAASTADTTAADDPGSLMPPAAAEQVTDWWGVIKRTDPGAQYDDYFERQDLG